MLLTAEDEDEVSVTTGTDSTILLTSGTGCLLTTLLVVPTLTGRLEVVVVVVWLAPELEDDDEPEELPRELLTVVLMKGVNWAMMFATRSPSLLLEDVVTCWTCWTAGRTCWTTGRTGAGAGAGAGSGVTGLDLICTKLGTTSRVSVYPMTPAE